MTAVLMIHDWHSFCSACGGNAKDEAAHIHGGPEQGGNMYAAEGSTLSDTNGCGAKFTAKESAPGSSYIARA